MTADEILKLSPMQAKAFFDILRPIIDNHLAGKDRIDNFHALNAQVYGFKLRSGMLDHSLNSYNRTYGGMEKIYDQRKLAMSAA